MQRYAGWARDNEGRAYPGALVSVYEAGTNTLAAIYSGAGDLSDPPGASNPYVTGSDGFFTFAAENGIYDIHISNGGNPVSVISNLTFSDLVATKPDWIDFQPQDTNPDWTRGRLFYQSSTDTLTLYNDISNTSLQIGQEMWVRVRNQSGGTIEDGKVVYVSGTTGQLPTILKASSASQSPYQIIGVVTADILNNGEGWVTVSGGVNDINTNHLTEGAPAYLSAVTAGELVGSAPDNAIQIGICIYKHPVHGKILIQINDANAYAKYSPKAKFTSTGGLAIQLTNKTGGNSVKGEVVTPGSSVNNSVVKITVDVPNPIGVFLDSGVADGQEAWVVVSGIADVYFVGDTTHGQFARGFLTSDGDSYVTGQALAEATPIPPFASDKHFYEIGHILESRTGAGLAKTVLHFN